MSLQLPPAEPPAPDVDELLEELRGARAELVDGGRIVHMLTADDPAPTRFARRRHRIEVLVAERRCELWAHRIAELSTHCRHLGIDPDAVL